jgi:hypothetical protein
VNTDGSLDKSFNPGTGVTGGNSSLAAGLTSIAVQTDGKIIIGGVFTNVNSTARYGIARPNTNGTPAM